MSKKGPHVRLARWGVRLALAGIGLISMVLTVHAEPGHGVTGYPFVLHNCGVDVRFDAPPRRAVALGQNTAEIMFLLGLEDRVAATAVWPSKVLPEIEAAYNKTSLLTTGNPSFEAVLNARPDFIAVQLLNTVGPHGVVARREAFSELGIPSYISPSACSSRSQALGLGSRDQPWHADYLYQEIEEIARIFNVSGRGQALVKSLQERERALRQRLGQGARDLKLLFWFSSPSPDADAWLCGTNGACDYIAGLVGGKNVNPAAGEWSTLGWEGIVALDPTVIVIARLDRQRWGLDDPQAKIRFLESDPVVRNLRAVRRHRIAVIDGQAMNPTIRTLGGAETLAAQLEQFGLLP